MTEEIFGLAKALGHVGAEDESALQPLCQAAEEELNGRLREGLTAADCGGAFPLAAAWLALSALTASGAASGVERFTAGDVTVEERSGAEEERASALRRQAEQVMAPYLRDDGFVFRGVAG